MKIVQRRIMAIDWGEKRIGVAVSDPLNLIAQPLTTIQVNSRKEPWGELQSLIDRHDIQTVVVGMPLRTDGKASEKAQIVKGWMNEAEKRLHGVRLVEIDERLTTKEAGRILSEGGVRAKDHRPHIDKIAAALILEQFLERQAKSTEGRLA